MTDIAVKPDGETALRELCLKHRAAVLEEFPVIGELLVDRHAVVLNSRNLKHIVEDVHQLVAGGADLAAVIRELLRVISAFVCELCESDDCIERRADVVAHIEEEGGFRLAGSLGLVLCFLELKLDFLLTADLRILDAVADDDVIESDRGDFHFRVFSIVIQIDLLNALDAPELCLDSIEGGRAAHPLSVRFCDAVLEVMTDRILIGHVSDGAVKHLIDPAADLDDAEFSAPEINLIDVGIFARECADEPLQTIDFLEAAVFFLEEIRLAELLLIFLVLELILELFDFELVGARDLLVHVIELDDEHELNRKGKCNACERQSGQEKLSDGRGHRDENKQHQGDPKLAVQAFPVLEQRRKDQDKCNARKQVAERKIRRAVVETGAVDRVIEPGKLGDDEQDDLAGCHKRDRAQRPRGLFQMSLIAQNVPGQLCVQESKDVDRVVFDEIAHADRCDFVETSEQYREALGGEQQRDDESHQGKLDPAALCKRPG